MNLVTLERVKQLGEIVGTEHDGQLNFLIESVSEWVKNYCGHDFEKKERTEKRRLTFGQTGLILRWIPVEKLLEIDKLSLQDVEVDERGLLQFRKLQGGDWLTIRYIGGYASVPKDVELATALEVLRQFRIRTSGESLEAERIGSYSYRRSRESFRTGISSEVEQLLRPYRRFI
jgi:hypothetical protein